MWSPHSVFTFELILKLRLYDLSNWLVFWLVNHTGYRIRIYPLGNLLRLLKTSLSPFIERSIFRIIFFYFSWTYFHRKGDFQCTHHLCEHRIQECLVDRISVWFRRTSSLVMAIWVLNLRLELYLSSDEDPKTNLNLIWDQIKTKRMAIWGYSSDRIYLCSQIKIQKMSDKRPTERILI